MQLKDYYSILEVPPSASPLVIKRAFRRLAQKYHPDKNRDNKLYEQKFREIHEAYKVLSDNRRRNDYNYARFEKQHPYSTNFGQHATPKTIVALAYRLRKQVQAADPARLNSQVVFNNLMHLFTHQNLQLFAEAADEPLNAQMVQHSLVICRPMTRAQVKQVVPILVALAGTHNQLLIAIRQFERQNHYQWLWNRYKMVVVMLVVLLFCLMMYFISR